MSAPAFRRAPVPRTEELCRVAEMAVEFMWAAKGRIATWLQVLIQHAPDTYPVAGARVARALRQLGITDPHRPEVHHVHPADYEEFVRPLERDMRFYHVRFRREHGAEQRAVALPGPCETSRRELEEAVCILEKTVLALDEANLEVQHALAEVVKSVDMVLDLNDGLVKPDVLDRFASRHRMIGVAVALFQCCLDPLTTPLHTPHLVDQTLYTSYVEPRAAALRAVGLRLLPLPVAVSRDVRPSFLDPPTTEDRLP